MPCRGASSQVCTGFDDLASSQRLLPADNLDISSLEAHAHSVLANMMGFECSLGLLGPGPNLRADPVFEGPVVILAEHRKDEMDAAVSGAACCLVTALTSLPLCACSLHGLGWSWQIDSHGCTLDLVMPHVP
jgi:hypothetical protein